MIILVIPLHPSTIISQEEYLFVGVGGELNKFHMLWRYRGPKETIVLVQSFAGFDKW